MELTASAASSKNTIWSIITQSFLRRAVFGLLTHSFGLTVNGPVYSEVVIPRSTNYSENGTTNTNESFYMGL